MPAAAIPTNEAERLAALRALDLLDTPAEAIFDNVTELAASICDVPISIISLVDSDRQWFKSSVGLTGTTESPRELAFCAHAILGRDLLEVADARLDRRFADNPFVLGHPDIRFYAGVPLIDGDDHGLGTLCVVDRMPRSLNPRQREQLRLLADTLLRMFDDRRERHRAMREAEAARTLAIKDYRETPAMIYSMDPEGRVTEVSDRWLEVMGYERDEIIGQPSANFVTPASLEFIRTEAFPEFQRTGAVSDLELETIAKNGEIVEVVTCLKAEKDESGAILRSLTVSVDVRAQKAAERAAATVTAQLRETNRLLLLAEEMASVGHWRFDLRGNEIIWSDEVCRIHGFPPGFQPTIIQAFAAYHPDDQQTVIDCVERARQARADFAFEARLIRADGAIRDVTSRGQVEIDDFGTVIALTGTFQDVTDRKAAELARKQRYDELRESYAKLEHQSAQLVAMAAELSAARDGADAASKAKSEFLASMSHELRTPLNGIIGFAELLSDTTLTDHQRHQVDLLKAAGRSLLAIINDVLDVSKIEAGHLDLERIPVAPESILDQVFSIVRAQAVEKRIELRSEHVPGIPAWIEGDPTRLRQILLNLVTNALKFTRHGSVTVRALRESARGEERLRFEVRDTGIGIPVEKQHLLFQTFSQVDRSTYREYGGTGLGLVICKRLAEAMGGEIGVSSVPGEGSTFWFTIALQEAAAPVAAKSAGPVNAAAASRILVAEDVYMNQVIVQSMLEGAGHHVVLVSNGAEAVRTVEEAPFDLVLMDLQMPVMDGLTAARAIRALASSVRTIPIVALTANAMSDEIAACRAAGMNAHVSKPIDRAALLAAVAEWSGRGGDAPRPAAPPPDLIDVTVLDDLEAQLGIDQVKLFAAMFQTQLATSLAVIAGTFERAAVQREAHILVSVAGNLGLTELTRTSRDLMLALKAGQPDVSGLIAAFDQAAARARSYIGTRYPAP